MITVLAGGTGSVKLVRGLALQTTDLKVVSNVGDNIWLHGLYVCPDIDTIIYGLADMLDKRQGWGVKNDSFGFLRQMEMLGEEMWFKIGDRDLATHLLRTNMLKNGKNLSEITDWMRSRYAIAPKIIPATDNPMETKVVTDRGEMHIQEFWVKYGGEPNVLNIVYSGADRSRVNPRAIDALKRSKIIVIAPANPITSIGPILAIKGIRKELIAQKKKIIAVSPMIGNEAVSGPAAKYMRTMDLQNSPIGVAKYYSDFVSKLIISASDWRLSTEINRLGIKAYETDIIMRNADDETRVALYLLKRFKNF
ncbi:MAG: 2-phospho-L-lactate transferase [Nitrososphaeraceae archaeon]